MGRTRRASTTRTRRGRGAGALEQQLKRHVATPNPTPAYEPYEGNLKKITSTGSTLLDLAISGGVVHGGGLPSGILVEAFGPSSSGKTVFLCEVAGYAQRAGGRIMFHDPEARLNKQFAQMFDFTVRPEDYFIPNTVPEVFQAVRKWDVDTRNVNYIGTDSLAALSTDMEMKKDEGDIMGQRRAKEFSQELRRTARVLQDKDYLMCCSNQIRSSMNTFGPKYISPGGEAIGFYASLRLRFGNPTKITVKKTYRGKDIQKVVGIEVDVEVFKSSVDAPYRRAPIVLYFDYGIDDVRANLQYIKHYSGGKKTYLLGGENIGSAMIDAIHYIENNNLESVLRDEVIALWTLIQSKFTVERKKKVR